MNDAWIINSQGEKFWLHTLSSNCRPLTSCSQFDAISRDQMSLFLFSSLFLLAPQLSKLFLFQFCCFLRFCKQLECCLLLLDILSNVSAFFIELCRSIAVSLLLGLNFQLFATILRLPSALTDAGNNMHVRWSGGSLVATSLEERQPSTIWRENTTHTIKACTVGWTSPSRILLTVSEYSLHTTALRWGRIRSDRIWLNSSDCLPRLRTALQNFTTDDLELEFGLVSQVTARFPTHVDGGEALPPG